MNFILTICNKKIQVLLFLILGLSSASVLSAKELQSAIDIKIQNLASADDRNTLAAIYMDNSKKLYDSRIYVCYSDATVNKSEAAGYKYYIKKKYRLESNASIQVDAILSNADVNSFLLLYKLNLKKLNAMNQQAVPLPCDYYLDYPKNIIKVRDFLLKNNINSFYLQDSITKSELESFATKRREQERYNVDFRYVLLLNENSFMQTINGGLRQRYNERHLSICFEDFKNSIGWDSSVQAAAVIDYMNLNKSLFGAANESVISYNVKECKYTGTSPHYIFRSYSPGLNSSPYNIYIDLESSEIESLLAKNAIIYAAQKDRENNSIKNIELEFMSLVEKDDKTHLVGLALKNPSDNKKNLQDLQRNSDNPENNGTVSICSSEASNIPNHQLLGYMQFLKGQKIGQNLITKPLFYRGYSNIDEFYSDFYQRSKQGAYYNDVDCNFYIDYPKNIHGLQNAILKVLPNWPLSRWGSVKDKDLFENYFVAWTKDLAREELDRRANVERERKRKEAESAASLQRRQQQAANEERVRRETVALESNMRQVSLGQGFPYTAYLSCEIASMGVNVILQSCFQNLELTNGDFYHNYTYDLHTISKVNTYSTNILPLRKSFAINARATFKMTNMRINIKILDNKSGAVIYQKSFVRPGEFIQIN